MRLRAAPRLQVQPLTLAGPVAIHEDDSQNHQEETQPGSVLGPKGVERGILSSSHFPERLQPAHPTSLSQTAPLQGSSSHSVHGLLPDPDNSLLLLELHHFIRQMFPPRILLRTGLGREQMLAKGVSGGTSTPSLPFAIGSYTGHEAPPEPTTLPSLGQPLSRKRKATRSLLFWRRG